MSAKTDTPVKNTKTKTPKATSAPKTPKATAAPKAPKAAPIVVEEKKVVAPAVVAVEEKKVEESSGSPKTNEFDDIISKLTSLAATINALKVECKIQGKKLARERRTAEKAISKRKHKGERSPSGFIKPTLISPEMAAFLGEVDGTEIARTDVTKRITTYIKSNKLQNPENGRFINADAKLKALLKWKDGDVPLSYFNLQTYLSPHFPKKDKAQVV